MSIISYSQNFEDVILSRALENISIGYYIDIGAHHPVIDSVSKTFYDKGWRGIHVEPTEKYANLLRENRPDETVIQSVVASTPGIVRFYEIPNTRLSNACHDIATEHQKKLGYPVSKSLLMAITLDNILELATSEMIHWLKIDVEGYEREVLQGWQTSTVRTWIVVIESTYPNTTQDTFQNWEMLILAKDYELVYRDGLNRYYLHKTQKDRRPYFELPPNIFDDFQFSGESSSMTSYLVRQYKEIIEQLKYENEKTQQTEKNYIAGLKHINTLAIQEKDNLKHLLHQTQTQQRTITYEHLKILSAREREYSIQLATLHKIWRQTEAIQRQQAETDKQQALENAQQRYQAECQKFEAQLTELRNKLQSTQQKLLRKVEKLNHLKASSDAALRNSNYYYKNQIIELTELLTQKEAQILAFSKTLSSHKY